MEITKLGAKLRVFMKWLNFSLISAKILVRRTSEIFYARFNKCVQEIVNQFALSGLGRRNSVLVSRRSSRRAQDCGSNVWAEKNWFTKTRLWISANTSIEFSRCEPFAPLLPQNATVQAEYGLLPQTQRLHLANITAVMITGTSGRAVAQIFQCPTITTDSEETLSISLYLREANRADLWELDAFCRGSNLHQYGLSPPVFV